MIYSARRCCGEIRSRLMTCSCRWYDARCHRCRNATPHCLGGTALWHKPQGNLGLRGPGLISMSCIIRIRLM